jgi:hypothetical protein
MLKAASLVTNMLLLSVPLRRFRMLLPVPLLIVAMLLLPFLLAIAHHLAILRICRQLPATRIGAAPALAIQLTANLLLGAARRGQKRTLAVDTTAGLAHRDSSGFEMKSFRRIETPEREQREIKNGYVITAGSTPVLASLEKGRRISLGERGMVTSRKRQSRAGPSNAGR